MEEKSRKPFVDIDFFENLGRRIGLAIVAVAPGHGCVGLVSLGLCRIPVEALPTA